jgi:pimeloyl-ACP methyl ester carboxylesterase
VGPIVAVEGVPFVADLLATRRHRGERAAAGRGAPQHHVQDVLLEFAAHNRAQLSSMIGDLAQVDRIAALGARSDPAAVGQAIYEMMTTDLREKVAAVASPSLLVVADAGGTAEARRGRRTPGGPVPDHRIVVVARSRHFVMLDAPGAFFGAVDAFLADPRVAATR